MRPLILAAMTVITTCGAALSSELRLECSQIVLVVSGGKDPIDHISVLVLGNIWQVVHTSILGSKYDRSSQYLIKAATDANSPQPYWQGQNFKRPNVLMTGRLSKEGSTYIYSELTYDSLRKGKEIYSMSSTCKTIQEAAPTPVSSPEPPQKTSDPSPIKQRTQASEQLSPALNALRKDAEAGFSYAQLQLGIIYGTGQGVRQDYVEAMKWFRKAADQDESKAQFSLGVLYDEGLGVQRDDVEAAKWYLKAATQGESHAQLNLGSMYDQGRGLQQNHVEAANWYLRAAEQGGAEAVKWIRKASDQGEPNAQYSLGLMYQNGGQDVPQDYAEAMRWFRKAAGQGEARAQIVLGLMYENGQGTLQDYAEAVKWYLKAAGQGDPNAQTRLGLMYENGHGVPQDYVQAHMWFNLSSTAGNYFGQRARDEIVNKMTSAQIAEAQMLAQKWQSSK